MASLENDDYVAMVIKKASFKGSPIIDACSNSECIAVVTFHWRVYTCDLTDDSTPQKYVQVIFPTSEGNDDTDVDIVSVCCGRYHFLALSNCGRVYSWGRNNYGQLGLPKKKQKHRGQDQEKQTPKPRLIKDLSSYDVIQIACGDDHSLALTRAGRVFSWGSNGQGQLGIGEDRRTRHHNAVPTEVEGLCGVERVVGGGAHTFAVLVSGPVYVWGSNSHGQLGLRSEEDVKLPVKLKSVQGKVKLISCGESHTSFLFENGKLWFIGMGVRKQPCEWSKSELSPARANRSYKYSSVQSIGRCTFVAEESSGRLCVLNHEKVQLDGLPQDLQRDALEETTFLDVCGTDTRPEWPPGCDNVDVKLWKVKKASIQRDATKTADSMEYDGSESVNSQGTRRRIIVILHNEQMGGHSGSTPSPRGKIPTLSAELLQSLSDIDEDITMETSKIASLQEVKIIFSSPACLNAFFPRTGLQEASGLNIDLKAARQAFEPIIGKEKLLEWISKVVCNDLCRNVQLLPCFDEDLRFYLILLECPIFRYPQFEWSRRVLAAVGRLLISRGGDIGEFSHLSRLARWWKFEPVSFRETVVAYQEAVLSISQRDEDMKTYLEVLKGLNQVNLEHDIVSVKTFYIPSLRGDVVEEEQRHFTIFPISQGLQWMSYPFLIDLQTKALLLELRCSNNRQIIEAQDREMLQRQLARRFWNPFLWYSSPDVPPVCLELTANRDDIFGQNLQMQLVQMLRYPRSRLQKPLRVTFEGERGIDEGALSLEFFRLVFDELVDPEKTSLFRYINEHDPTQSKIWFCEKCSCTNIAEICGLLLGLSLHNQALVPLPAFPQLLYAKLLGKGPKSEMEEVKELDKDFADQMSNLLNGSEEDVVASCYGEELELDNGESVEITKTNVHFYVQKRVRHFLAPCQFAAFKEGFSKIWGTSTILNIFRPIELEALVTGEENFDWVALEQSTLYIGPYTDSHPTIKMFWDVFHALDDDMKRKFLVFIAGSDRVPVGGLQNLGLTIDELQVLADDSIDDQDNDSPEDKLSRLCPVAQCCDNNQYNRTLRLPMYTSKELIEDRLMATLSFYNCPFHIA